MAITSGSCSFTALRNSSDFTLIPRSTTSNPDAKRRVATMLFPMLWISPNTVPMITLPREAAFFPCFSISVIMGGRAFLTASDAQTRSGRNSSPVSNLSPISRMLSVNARAHSIGSIPSSIAFLATASALSISKSRTICFNSFSVETAIYDTSPLLYINLLPDHLALFYCYQTCGIN